MLSAIHGQHLHLNGNRFFLKSEAKIVKPLGLGTIRSAAGLFY